MAAKRFRIDNQDALFELMAEAPDISSEGESDIEFEPEGLPETSSGEDSPSEDECNDDSGEEGLSQEDVCEAYWDEVLPGADPYSNGVEFSVRNPGGRSLPLRNSPAIVYFNLFLTMDLLIHIVRETNKYGRDLLAAKAEWIQIHPHSRLRRWMNGGLTVALLKKWIGLSINMGIIRKKNVKMYWDLTHPSQATPFFGQVMPLWQYLIVTRMIHLNDNATAKARGEEGFDPWHKVRPVLDSLNRAFKKYYVPRQLLSIDESMIGMKNRVAYIQYMPNKRHARFGIKKFEVCDSSNSYILHVDLYAGRDKTTGCEKGFVYNKVMSLLKSCDLLNKGYHLMTNNYYTSVGLAEDLLLTTTLLTGTVRVNSRGLPPEITRAKLQPGGSKYLRKGGLLACAFREKKSHRKPVLLLSTASLASDVLVHTRCGQSAIKPQIILDYNKGMGGVDVSDRKIYEFAAERPTHRYWSKIWRNLIDVSIMNAYELYKINTEHSKLLSRHSFVVDIIEALCLSQEGTSSEHSAATPLLAPSSKEHGFAILPAKKERDCAICSDRSKPGGRKRSRHWCPGCNVGIHERCYPLLVHSTPCNIDPDDSSVG
ncbi:piggyBac transposable element-derived protein 4-like [Ambystoma mexicanum]|uniref:piggyBac transposable element-derived protein 4-like n=1 Tax=Ambystoma mexicanum TaxID=8296 RepID=UPI0037E784C2